MKTLHLVALVLHLIGLVLGLGAATMTDLLFITCVRSRRVGDTLTVVMEVASRIVLAGYGILVVSGVVLITTGTHTSQRFWGKMLVVAVIGANGIAAHRITLPRLSHTIRTGARHVTLGFLAQLSVVAAISVTSWYAALVMGAWKAAPLSLGEWMVGYLIALLGAVVVSLLLTPRLLRVTHPDFDAVFPLLAPAALQAASVWPEPHGSATGARELGSRHRPAEMSHAQFERRSS
ncbi:MAG: hypothetical protein ABIR68_08715 [Ilumatobacteraceae bacterium]